MRDRKPSEARRQPPTAEPRVVGSRPRSARSASSASCDSHVVVTSIRRPSAQVGAFLRQTGWQTTLVADLKTPRFRPPAGLAVLSVERQRRCWPRFASQLPWRHYARKNLGYLYAIKAGARCVFDTDDDNAPLEPWRPCPPGETSVVAAVPGSRWVNVYAHFGAKQVWPRGFPLEQIGRCGAPAVVAAGAEDVVVWQGLVEGDPDVDAIFRLTRCDPVTFQPASPLVLPSGSYCPFNSQNTWWTRLAFPYLYLPTTVTFRFTDILRSLVAQRCFWAHGWRLGFHGPTARQERNEHDLLVDFRDELPCYLETARIVSRLDALSLGQDAAENLRRCYAALVEPGWVRSAELPVLETWLTAVAAPSGPPTPDV